MHSLHSLNVVTFSFLLSLVLALSQKKLSSPFSFSDITARQISDEPQNSDAIDVYIDLVSPFPEFSTSTSNLTSEAEEQLDWLVGRYRSFIHDMGFDGAEFTKMEPKLNEQLMKIGTWVEHVFPQNTELLKRIRFVRHVSKVMKNAVESIPFFIERSTDQHLVRSLIQLNVRLLTLRNPLGDPDPLILGYATDVASFIRILSSWAYLFNQFTDVPLSIRLMFETQFVDASHTLQILDKHVRNTRNIYESQLSPRA